MKSTANCQPEQSIEPDSQNYGSSSDSEERGTNSNSSTRKQEKNKKRKLFVPIHKTTKNASKKREENPWNQFKSLLKMTQHVNF